MVHALVFHSIKSIGQVSAEEDAILSYFLTTDAVTKIANNDIFLILGRKGAGKTALVKHFTSGSAQGLYKALNLRGYPWGLHAKLADERTTELEQYVASWRYLIAAQSASVLLKACPNELSDAARRLRDFFNDNYGAVSIDIDKVFSPKKLIFKKGTLNPAIAGVSVGSVDFETVAPEFGQLIDAVADEILTLINIIIERRGISSISVHFDELDFGIEKFDRARELMIVGLVLAAQSVRNFLGGSAAKIRPFVYLRTDLWDSLSFSDKNKIARGPALLLEWNSVSLREMVDIRLTTLIKNDVKFADLIDERQMRGTQQKWDHIVARTFDRPRDIIRFINQILESKFGTDTLISNEDVAEARQPYSSYFKAELDDEIKAHWPQWDQALNALTDIGYVTFDRMIFENAYSRYRTGENNVSDYNDALRRLFDYSVVAYLRPTRGGGTDWVWRYKNPDSTYDSRADKFKVHLGLRVRLRMSGWDSGSVDPQAFCPAVRPMRGVVI